MKKALLFIGFLCILATAGYAARPTTQSSSLSYNNLNCSSVKINWTAGDGAARLIVAKRTVKPDYVPVDGSDYSADPTFGNSTEYGNPGDSNFIVYNGTGTNFVTVTNLLPGHTYAFTIYEHDNIPNNSQYLTSNAPSISVTTYNIHLNFSVKIIDSCQMTNSFEFTNQSSSTIPGITYKFDFGNGTSTSSPVTHKFSAVGYPLISLSPITSITGCPSQYQKNVKIFPKKIAYIDHSLFKDTQCLESNYFIIQAVGYLMPFPSSITFRWFYGDGDSSTDAKMKRAYKKSGIFNVMVELTSNSYSMRSACKDTLFFPLTILPSPVGNITLSDTFECFKNNRFNFDNPDNTLTYYKWYFGDKDSSDLKSTSHTYKDTGTYHVIHVAYANTGCKGRDTVDVHVLPNLDNSFTGLDTFYCESSVADILIPGKGGGSFYGYPVSANKLIPNLTGSYILKYIVSDAYCTDSSSLAFRIAPNPQPDLGNDTAVCSALSYIISANTPGTYLWSTGETSPSITVNRTGNYSVDVTLAKCSAADTTNITFSTPPKIDIGGDTILCKGGGIWLNASYPGATYLWNTGSTDSTLYAFKPGKYLVTVSNPCGVTQDSIFLFFQTDYCDLFMANAFSPGNDLVNDVFMPRGRNINVGLFQIYNRWGELVFETDQNNVGWNGTYKGEVVQEGLYIWKLFYTTVNGPYIKKNNAVGQVVLIR